MQRNLGAEALDEGDALVRIEADLVTEPIAEGPHDEVFAASVFESMWFTVARKVADRVAWANG
jgi:hypothetical protein